MQQLLTAAQVLLWLYATGTGIALLVNTGMAVDDYPYASCEVPPRRDPPAPLLTFVCEGPHVQNCSGKFMPGAGYLAAIVFWLLHTGATGYNHVVLLRGDDKPPGWFAFVVAVLKVLVTGAFAGASLKKPEDNECLEYTDLRLAAAVVGVAVLIAGCLVLLICFYTVCGGSCNFREMALGYLFQNVYVVATVALMLTGGAFVVGVHGLVEWAKDQIEGKLFASLYVSSIVEEAFLGAMYFFS